MAAAITISSTDAWSQARKLFCEDLTEDEAALFENASPENVLSGTRLMQNKHQIEAITQRIRPLVAAIEQYGEALDVFSNTSSLLLCPLWGGMRVILHLAREFGKYFEKLVSMFTRIGDVLPRFRIYERLFPNNERLIQTLSLVYLDILRFCASAKRVFRHKKPSITYLKVSFKLVWKPFDQQFEKILSDFRQHQKNIEKEAGLSHMLEAENAWALEHQSRLALEKERKEKNRIKLLTLLSTIDYEGLQSRLERLRHQQTGMWLTETEQFKEWKSEDKSSCLSCCGIAGSGKTVLCSSIISIVSDESIKEKSTTTYHYCDYLDVETLKTRIVLGSIIKQLLQKRDTIPEDIELRLRELYKDGLRVPSPNELIEVLCSIVKIFPRTYIFIDGLDECQNEVKDDILIAVRQLISLVKPLVKVFLSFRHDTRILNALKKHHQVKMEEAQLTGDIVRFVEDTVQAKLEAGDLIIKNTALKQEIIKELITKAHGMFLWVYYQLEEICEPPQSDSGIREALRNLPEGLSATYQRILQRIQKRSPSPRLVTTIQRILKWAVCARRPLSIDELKEAIAFEPTDKSWNGDKISSDSSGKSLIQACCNLVVLDDYDRSVRPAHHTVQQFLLSETQDDSTRHFHFSLKEANLYTGEICVAYLSFSDFETQIIKSAPESKPAPTKAFGAAGLSQMPRMSGLGKVITLLYQLWSGLPQRKAPDTDFSRFLDIRKPITPSTVMEEKYQLLNYVIQNWTWHSRCFTAENTILWQHFRQIALEKRMAFDFRDWGSNQGPPDLPYLKLFDWAVGTGHAALLNLLYSPPRGAPFSEYCRRSMAQEPTAMMIASDNGFVDVLRLLLSETGANVSDPVLLIQAAENGHEAIVRLLVERDDVEADSKDSRGQTPLSLAARAGHKAVVQLLVERDDVEADLKDEYGQTPLSGAAENGHEAVVRLLVERDDVEADSKDKSWQTPLSQAAENGHEAIVRLLVERDDVEADSKDYRGRTPLLLAAKAGHKAVVQLLVERDDVEADSKDKSGHTPLSRAAENGHEAVVRLLVERDDVEADSKDSRGQTPLSGAAENGHEAVVQLLVERDDVEADSEDHRGRTPLLLAAGAGHKAVVQLLVERDDVEADSEDKFGHTPLSWAAINRHEAIVELLAEQYHIDADSEASVISRVRKMALARLRARNRIEQQLLDD